MKLAISHESLMVPSYLEVTPCHSTDLLSQSLPENAFYSALPRERSSYSPASHSSNLLQVPDNNQLFWPVSERDRGNERFGGRVQNALRGSSSLGDLSASAQEDTNRQSLAVSHLMRNCSNGLVYHIPTISPPWLNLSPRTSPKTSPLCSPTSPFSTSTLSPPFSPDNLVSNMAHKCSPPLYTHVQLPNQTSFPHQISPASAPHCSPNGFPLKSQTQICIRSVGAEC